MMVEFLVGSLSSFLEGRGLSSHISQQLPTWVTCLHTGKGGVCFLRETLRGWPCQTSRVNGHQEHPWEPLCQPSRAHDLSEWAPSGELKVSLRILQHILALSDPQKSFNCLFLLSKKKKRYLLYLYGEKDRVF